MLTALNSDVILKIKEKHEFY